MSNDQQHDSSGQATGEPAVNAWIDEHQPQNTRQMTPDELEANGLPRDFHARIPNGPDSHRFATAAGRRAGKATRLNELKARHARKRWVLPAALSAVALLLGIGIGASSEPKTVEKIVEKPVEKRVEVKVPVPTVPAACLEALTLNEEAFDISAEAMGAIARYDMAGAKVQNGKLSAITPRVNAAKAQCRAAK